jgi:hypothetical protein
MMMIKHPERIINPFFRLEVFGSEEFLEVLFLHVVVIFIECVH